MKLTKKDVSEWTLDHRVHEEKLRAGFFMSLTGGMPRHLAGKSPDEIVGRRLSGSTYKLTFKIPQRIEFGEPIEFEGEHFTMSKLDVESCGRTSWFTIHCSRQSDEPNGFQFFDEKVAKWFNGPKDHETKFRE